MFVRLENTPRDYAWGSTTAIAELLGREPSGGPEAELWLGTHPGSPTRISDPTQVGGYATLADWVTAKPELSIGFLLKILAAGQPLSLQAHPSLAQARDGYAREEAAGVPLTSPTRNYKDRNHKPELIVALSSTFDALCGFRSREETLRVLREFIVEGRNQGIPTQPLVAFSKAFEQAGSDEEALTWALEWLLTGANGVQELITACVDIARADIASEDIASEDIAKGTEASSRKIEPTELATVRELAAEYPGDPGIVLALLLNRVRLTRGEALYLPAGNMHAYLSGLGVELMAASDNVLRGGLTPKHIDVAELLAITQCRPLPVPILPATLLAAGVEIFAPAVDDFALLHVLLETPLNGGQASMNCDGPAIVICTDGEVVLTGNQSSLRLRRGDYCFITPDEGVITLEGFGEIFGARKGLSPVISQQMSV